MLRLLCSNLLSQLKGMPLENEIGVARFRGQLVTFTSAIGEREETAVWDQLIWYRNTVVTKHGAEVKRTGHRGWIATALSYH
jgi:hypothetical protein